MSLVGSPTKVHHHFSHARNGITICWKVSITRSATPCPVLSCPVRSCSNLPMQNAIIVIDGCVEWNFEVPSTTFDFHNMMLGLFTLPSSRKRFCVFVENAATKLKTKDGSITNDEWLYWQNGNVGMVTADSLRNECFIKH